MKTLTDTEQQRKIQLEALLKFNLNEVLGNPRLPQEQETVKILITRYAGEYLEITGRNYTHLYKTMKGGKR